MTDAPLVSVVIATFDRRASLERLLHQLAEQTLSGDQFEVIVVDDGSPQPVEEWLAEGNLPRRLTVLRQENAGASAARHRGALEAGGALLVITDDDMQVGPGFLGAHLARHVPGSRRVVVGRIRSSSKLSEMPLFERFHADLLDRWGPGPLRGDAVCTGNLSLRRSDYLEVGGFDCSLERAEDVDLGFRLEQAGVDVVFSEDAATVHESDHTDFRRWRRQVVSYGRCWTRIARKHPRLTRPDPWHSFFAHALAKRPFVVMALVSPTLGAALAHSTQRVAEASEWLGLRRFALRLISLLWALEFFRGVRDELGGLGATVRSCTHFLENVEKTPEPEERVGNVAILMGRAVRAMQRRPPAATRSR